MASNKIHVYSCSEPSILRRLALLVCEGAFADKVSIASRPVPFKMLGKHQIDYVLLRPNEPVSHLQHPLNGMASDLWRQSLLRCSAALSHGPHLKQHCKLNETWKRD